MGFCPRHHKQLRAGITELWNIGVGRELWHHKQVLVSPGAGETGTHPGGFGRFYILLEQL